MGKNYRNCTLLIIQTPPHSRLQEDPTRRKGLITNSSSSASTGLRIREKYGESISPSPNSEKQLVNFSPSKKKTPEDCSKVLPFLEECTDMDFFPLKNLSSITFLVLLPTSFSIVDFKPESLKTLSMLNLFTRPELLLSKDTSALEKAQLLPLHTWLGPKPRRKSTSLPFLHSKLTSLAGPPRRKTKEKIKEKKKLLDSNLIICRILIRINYLLIDLILSKIILSR